MKVFLETSKQLKEKKIIGGATALVSIFLHDSNKVFIANVGDCRAVVGGSGEISIFYTHLFPRDW